ncbi:MAG: DNA-binding protein WhiA, partial [Clostridia bacterium]|nr:DNA-binding protein WhiA [Clostridia bacterium]
MPESFSQKVKSQIAAAEIRKKCCRRTGEDLEAVRESGWGAGNLSSVWNRCRCENCRAVFFRGIFCAAGSVTDPAKSYQLDMSFPDRESAEAVRDMAGEIGFSFGLASRRGRSVLYLRESGAVEDFLAFLGATAASFEVMNAKID